MRDKPSTKTFKLLFCLIFLWGAWIRFIDVNRPADGRVRESWRECDYASVARNYFREGMNILYPRIDWRGNGPGFAEMEFPIFPWTVAVLYKIFGYHEIIGRYLAFLFSLLALLFFFLLARHLLPLWGALSAFIVFALSPLVIRVSNSLQPEGLMLFLYILATYAFIHWLDDDQWKWYGISASATALCILVKIPSAHIGVFFLMLLLMKKGTKSLIQVRTWVFGIAALFPAFLWSMHAHRMWLEYGNSLGVSNEYHWFGLDLIHHASYLMHSVLGLIRIEIFNVWMPLGFLVLLVAIFHFKNSRAVRISFYWLAAICLYYFVTIRTTGDEWATYYHVVTVPAMALLFGTAGILLYNRMEQKKFILFSLAIPAAVASGLILAKWLFSVSISGQIIPGVIVLLVSAAAAVLQFALCRRLEKKRPFWNTAVSLLLYWAFLSTILFQGLRVSTALKPQLFQEQYLCALSFRPLVPKDSLILVSGGISHDETGRPVAYNAPYMFFWMDRKGFSIARDNLSLKSIKEYAQRGASYFVLEKEAAKAFPRFLDNLRQNYILASECATTYLFKL